MNSMKIPTAPITDLLEEIKGFDSTLFQPADEVCEGHDKIIGSCPEDLRRFYSFSRYCERELKQLNVEREFSSDKDPDLDRRMHQWSKKHQLAKAMLWFALWEYFNAYQAGCGISLTKDWQVVLTEHQGRPQLPPGLAGFLGMIGGGE
ncbi:MAG: hypothetical protein WA734_14310 [Candidatus Acidiferrales bacterium]